MNGNTVVNWVLRSPLHGVMSRSTLIVSYQGRKSGQWYHVPVNYVQDNNQMVTTSQRDRVWWRNLRAGSPVTIRLRGQDVRVVPTVYEEPADVASRLRRIFEINPRMARYFQVEMQAGQPLDDDLKRVSQERVIIVWQLDS